MIPADAHYLNNATERAIEGVKTCMSPRLTGMDAFLLAIGALNTKEAVSGYSPAQWVMGRAPDIEGNLHEVDVPNLAKFTAEQTEKEYQDNAKRRMSAETAATQKIDRSREVRARNSQARRAAIFRPGELVHDSRQGKQSGPYFNKRGRFVGPARVLAMETERNYHRDLLQKTPSTSVWLSRGGRLILAAAGQLRYATRIETAAREGAGGVAPDWCRERIAERLIPDQYIDVRPDGEVPAEEYERAAAMPGIETIENQSEADRHVMRTCRQSRNEGG